MNKLLAYILAFSVLIGGATFWYNKHIDSVVLKAQTEIADKYNNSLVILQKKVDLKTVELKETIKEMDDAKNIEINANSKHYESVILSLRERTERPTSQSNNNPNAGNAEGPKGAYPAELFREDAEAFANFGKDAEQLRINLLSCYKQYDEVKEANDKLSTIN